MAADIKLPSKIVGTYAGEALQGYNIGVSALQGVPTSEINKLWRAKIALNRATSDKPKVDTPYTDVTKNLTVNLVSRDTRKSVDPKVANRVIIYNLYSPRSNSYEYIEIQNRPYEINFKPETTWATIKSMGRNTPLYHFTGAEDTVQFNITWFARDPNYLEEVVDKCKLLESWSKADAYTSAPPILKLQWGDSEIFEDDLFILSSATYTFSNFNNLFLGSLDRHRLSNNLPVNGRLLPRCATQEIILKRTSVNNLTHSQIQGRYVY